MSAFHIVALAVSTLLSGYTCVSDIANNVN